MNNSTIIGAVVASLAAVPVFAQDPPSAPPPSGLQISGSVTPAVLQADSDTNSSKFTEYRDFNDNLILSRVRFSLTDRKSAQFFDFSGMNVSRDDQTILVEGGKAGVWNAQVAWVEVPHRLSNKALTPYIQRQPGLFDVPATIPITFKKLATGAADAPGVVASDALVAAYQASFLAPTSLGTQTNSGRFAWTWMPSERLSFGAAYQRRTKSGLKSTFGPIGDRPPRTLNIQMTEPVDYRTSEIALSMDHDAGRYQARVEYLFSDFSDRIDTLQWENVYATAPAGATFDVWDRAVSVFGRRPLPPDNRFHNISGTVGGDLPFDSRATASVAYGRLEQNEPLLPYSFNSNILVAGTLPRATAQAEVTTVQWLADYAVRPTARLNLRAWLRHYGLDNNTPQAQWQYATSDTSNLNGTVSYKNRRVNLAYASDRTNLGIDATYRLRLRSTVSFGYEREDISRDYREADTGEDRFTAAFRTRAPHGINVRARYLFGARSGGTYDGLVTRQSYWYARADAGADADNPAFTFSNHPDMRRFDASDRQRQQIDVTVNLTPAEALALSAFVRYRRDDFDSDVTPSQPLLGTGLADQSATSPGDQLGRLKDTRFRYGTDLFTQPTDRVSLTAFLNYDKGTGRQRSLEFNENNKQNPSTVATASLGPWTRAGSQWTADFDDRTWSAGAAATMQLVPERVTAIAEYTLSLAEIDITYAGFGVTNWDGTPFPPSHEFAFSAPPPVRENLRLLTLRVEIPISAVTLLASYSYETYALDDWQQSAGLPWVEAVGNDTLLRDTSRSHQWGNRLFTLGTYLAPSYDAHIGFVGFRYRF